MKLNQSRRRALGVRRRSIEVAVFAKAIVGLLAMGGCNRTTEPVSSSRSMGQSVLDVAPGSNRSDRQSKSAFESNTFESNAFESSMGVPESAPARASEADAPVEVPPPVTSVRSHTIVRGDTLWSIATRYYGDGKRFREILEANPGLSESKLPVGKAIIIP